MTTCNDLLSDDEINEIKQHLNLGGDIEDCILQEFDTEFDFSRKIRWVHVRLMSSKLHFPIENQKGGMEWAVKFLVIVDIHSKM